LITLRDYQEDIVKEIREALAGGIKKLGLQLMTGGGKTAIAHYIIMNFLAKRRRNGKKGGKVFFITKGNKLLDQITESFNVLPYGIIWADRTTALWNPMIIMSAPTYISNPSKWKEYLKEGELFFIDEAHEINSDGYRELMNDIPEGKIIIGLSATFVYGANGKGHTFWEKVLNPITGRKLEEMGVMPHREIITIDTERAYLDEVSLVGGDYNRKTLYAVSKKKMLFGNMMTEYKKHNPDKLPAVAFCINIQHAKDVAKEFQEAGITPLLIHSKMPKEEKSEFNKNLSFYLSSRDPFAICSVDMLSKGVDIPQLKVGLMMRPTKSKMLYYQQFGRLTRKENIDKDETVTMIDFTRNFHDHGDPYQKVLPDIIDRKDVKKQRKSSVSPRRCMNCGSLNQPYHADCIFCGESMLRGIDIQHIDIELKPVTFKERDEKLVSFLKQKSYVQDMHKLPPTWKFKKAKERFGAAHWLKSEHIPNAEKSKLKKEIDI